MEYDLANAEMTSASATFRTAETEYRARKIGDSEYLAARKAYKIAEAKYDAAFAIAAGWAN